MEDPSLLHFKWPTHGTNLKAPQNYLTIGFDLITSAIYGAMERPLLWQRYECKNQVLPGICDRKIFTVWGPVTPSFVNFKRRRRGKYNAQVR
jgi:hypothetical protein